MLENNLKPHIKAKFPTTLADCKLDALEAALLLESQKPNPKPHTIVESETTRGQEFDACYLVYGDKRLSLSATEYVLLQGLLDDTGVDLKEASDQRHVLRKRPLNGSLGFSPTISNNTSQVVLSRLREKIADVFPDLVIPLVSPGNKRRLRLWTRAEIEAVRKRIESPDDNVCIVTDERGLSHLLVNRHEIRPDKKYPGISSQHLVLASILLLGEVFGNPVGVQWGSHPFLATWKKLTGKKSISRDSLKAHMSNLRGAFKVAGWAINYYRESRTYQLIPPAHVLKPFTTIETRTTSGGRKIDVYYLKYGAGQLRISPTEYALLQGLVSGGLDLENAGEIRHALTKNNRGGHLRQEVLSDGAAKRILSRLRRKVVSTFSDLVIPIPTSGNTGRLRLLTRTEIKNIHERLANPDDGVCLIIDEHGRRRLFVNKHEIRSYENRPSISPQHFALASILLDNALYGDPVCLKRDSEAFLARWRELTGKNGIPRNSLDVHLSGLRGAFRVAGWAINRLPPNSGEGEPIHQLTSLKPEQSEVRRRKSASSPRTRASYSSEAILA